MQTFKNILVVHNGQVGADDVLSHGAVLARTKQASLTILDVRHEGYASLEELAERRKHLNRIRLSLEADGVRNVAVAAASGTPYLEVIHRVLQNSHDLVVVGADLNVSLNSIVFGSTESHLARKCPCPVWIIKPGQRLTSETILACIGSTDGTTDSQTDRTVLDLSASLASSVDARLHVAHAWQVDGADRETILSEVSDRVRGRIIDSHKTRRRDSVERLVQESAARHLDPTLHLPRASQPHWAILDLLNLLEADTIVMGSLGRTGIAGFFVADAAETVLAQARCSVLMVKPNGFVSPVVFDEELVPAA